MGPGPDTFNFGKLNPAERADLSLLAQGHTAKSIANLTGRSVGAVNERLREARRKTGLGSSREVARLLAAQENRDELIGVGDIAPATASASKATGRGWRWKGAMIVTMTIAGVALAALLMQGPVAVPQTTDSNTSLAGQRFSDPNTDPQSLHNRLLAETRDEMWAPKIEAAIVARLAQIPGVVGPVKVKCGSTICEAAGWLGQLDARSTKGAMRALQDAPLRDSMRALGLDDGTMWFSNDKEHPDRAAFALFWQRKS